MKDITPSSGQPMSVQGVDLVTRSDLDPDTVRSQMPGFRLWGHRIDLTKGGGIECEECEMSEEIPDILQQSSGFREVVYKLYILGKFKNTKCEPTFETDQSATHDRTTNVSHTTTTDSSVQKLQLDNGYVIADGGLIHKSTSDKYAAGDMLTDRQWIELVHEAQPATTTIGDMSSTVSDMGDSFGSIGDTMYTSRSTFDDLQKEAGIDTSTSSSTQTSVNVNGDVDEKSMKEKFASALCEKAGLR